MWWDRYQHVNMIRTAFCLDYFHSLSLAQFSQYLPWEAFFFKPFFLPPIQLGFFLAFSAHKKESMTLKYMESWIRHLLRGSC